MTKDNPLGYEKIGRLLFQYSVPSIVGMTVSAFYNIVDRMFIGNSPDLGTDGLAGITVAFPVMIITLALGILFGVGGATLFSLRLGEGKPQDAEYALGNSFFLMISVGLLYSAIGQIFLRPLLSAFGASADVLPYATEYMRTILFGAVFQMVSLGFNHFIRADGSPRIAMLSMLLGAGVNIMLDPLFIYVFRWGMTGAALATVLAQGCSFIWVIAYFRGRRCQHRLRLDLIKPRAAIIGRIITLGLPGFFLQLANSLLNVTLNRKLQAYGGDIAISGMGIINSLGTLLILPVIGTRQGAQPIISFNYGAEKYPRVKQAVLMAIVIATLMLIGGTIIIRTIPETLIRMFNQDPDLLSFGRHALLTWFLCLPTVGFQIMASSYFQAIGKSAVATFLTLTRQVIFLIPALLIFPVFWGLEGLLYAAPFADFFAAIITGVFFTFSIRRLGRNF